MRIKIEPEGRVWRWSIFDGSELLAGGLCRTKSDAQSDAETIADLRGYEILTSTHE